MKSYSDELYLFYHFNLPDRFLLVILQMFSGSILDLKVDYKAALGKLFLAFVWFWFWSVENVKIKVINIQLGS